MFSAIFVLVIVLIAGAIVTELKRNKRRDTKRNNSFKSGNNGWGSDTSRYRKSFDTGYKLSSEKQLELVSSKDASFKVKKLMNAEEYSVFKQIEKKVIPCFSGCRVFSQVSLGEILEAERRFHQCINSKRVDILIIDPFGTPVLVVEYQGSGHFQSNAPSRDAIKKEALRKAGVKYVEIFEGDSNEHVEYMVKNALENVLVINKKKMSIN